MKKMACGTAAFAVLFGLGACFDNPSAAVNNGNFHLVQAAPTVAWVRAGDSDQVLLRFVNDANNGVVTSFNIVNPSPNGIAVHYVGNYRPVFLQGQDTLQNVTDKDQQDYYVVGVAAGEYTFHAVPTINTADTGTITVRVPPRDLGTALSAHTATAATTITITAPAFTRFTPTSAVTWTTGTSSATTISADSTTLTTTVTHGTGGAATVTNLHLTFPDITTASAALASLVTRDSLTTVP
ncbi:MAG TPA: hypothetical protein VHW65_06010 [Gemmatimonadales bacterium]|jgi:hypothetical protein|nr:hypothetical protein [Gemmatimonadales bacterium]